MFRRIDGSMIEVYADARAYFDYGTFGLAVEKSAQI